MKKSPKRETAAEAYKARAAEIEVQMKALTAALEVHRRKHETRAAYWSMVGDLAHIREVLAEAIAFLSLGEVS